MNTREAANVALGCFLLFGLPLIVTCINLWVENRKLRGRLALYRKQETELSRIHRAIQNSC